MRKHFVHYLNLSLLFLHEISEHFQVALLFFGGELQRLNFGVQFRLYVGRLLLQFGFGVQES